MALVNFSAPFTPLAPPPLAQTHYYQPPKINYELPQARSHNPYHAGPYSYPTPQEQGRTPFFGDYRNHQPPPPTSQVQAPPPLPRQPQHHQQQQPPQQPQPPFPPNIGANINNNNNNGDRGGIPEKPPGFTRVHTSSGPAGPNHKTRLHAVVDYDDYAEYDDGDPTSDDKGGQPPVTPIQGPIYLKNGTVPVVPLYSYPVLNNGTFVQIPVLWTALSVALGLELRGEIIRGVPCIKRNQQLFCPTAGNTYPLERIELFIDENKALMKRMYGDFSMNPETGPRNSGRKRKREAKDRVKPGVPDLHADPGPDPINLEAAEGASYFSKLRNSRQSFRNNNQSSETGRIDACESKVEIVTPYWASNSAGKIRAIVNTQHFEQAIHQEVCSKVRTNRCGGDCGCEQKYKWHRLLAYDPDNDCKGIFMDWFLFPSCCVCRCNPP